MLGCGEHVQPRDVGGMGAGHWALGTGRHQKIALKFLKIRDIYN